MTGRHHARPAGGELIARYRSVRAFYRGHSHAKHPVSALATWMLLMVAAAGVTFGTSMPPHVQYLDIRLPAAVTSAPPGQPVWHPHR